jgi:hypothetical protein
MKRILIISLGAFWLLDGILQLQPAMFTGAFVNQVIAPTLIGQPHVLKEIILFGILVATINPFWFNVIAAGVQLLIGALLIGSAWSYTQEKFISTQRFALWLSIVWALIIWIFGEGFGEIATGSATFYIGAPGSALLYLILAVFLLLRTDNSKALKKLPLVAGIIFLVSAALNLAPIFWQLTTLSIIDNFIAIAILVALGIFLIIMPQNRAVAWITTIFLVIVWWIGQNFGGILTFPNGIATDPNSAIVFILFLLPSLVKAEI